MLFVLLAGFGLLRRGRMLQEVTQTGLPIFQSKKKREEKKRFIKVATVEIATVADGILPTSPRK